jgi:hypothetical protein
MVVRPEDIAAKTGSGFSKEVIEARFNKYEPKIDRFLMEKYRKGHSIILSFGSLPTYRDNGPSTRHVAGLIRERYEDAGWTVLIDYPNTQLVFSGKITDKPSYPFPEFKGVRSRP